ncbi:MAG: DUF2332 domain-containing protein [Actinobacteria bacterium]|nr:DUF2332 domain-containing protein [Actinomycetota bacterium]
MSEALALVRDQALEVGRGWSGPGALPSWRLTGSLFDVLAEDNELLTVAAEIPPDRLPALLFVASVLYLADRYPEEPFAAYLPSTDVRTLLVVDGHFAERYRAFCLQHRQELAAVWSDRTYQMNEVARCAQIASALGVLNDLAPGRQVAIVDIGTGAGFGLLADHYEYRFSDGLRMGPPTSAMQITCDLTGTLSPRCHRLPVIADRVGIDLHPIDVNDTEACAWLKACLPPEVGALERARHAIEAVRDADLEIIRGEANEILPGVLERFSGAALVCVIDTYTAVFFEAAEQRRLHDMLAAHARQHDVAWISLDPLVPLGTQARHTVQGTDVPSHLIDANRRGGVFGVLSITAYLAGGQTTRLLGTAHPSGTRMEWLDRATATDHTA